MRVILKRIRPDEFFSIFTRLGGTFFSVQLNLPLMEGVQKHFRSFCATPANRERLTKFFLEPMLRSLNGLTEADMTFALHYYLKQRELNGNS